MYSTSVARRRVPFMCFLQKVFQILIEKKDRNTIGHTCPAYGNTNVRTCLDVSETH